MIDPEDREQQAAISRLLLYHLNAPIVEGCRLRGVLPTPGAVRIAIHVAPAYIPGILRTVLTRTQLYSSGDISDVMGMTLIRLHPEEITPDPDPDPDPEPEQCQALTVLRALTDPGEDEDPFLIGFLMRGESLMRLYVLPPGHPGLIGADIRLTGTSTALIAALPSLIEEVELHQPVRDDPHCDLLVDLTDW
ncbi:hypothetical protein ABT063_26815 [Streptomyces sp. NPDC002838]|uniref:hypothetical protein n=1 Tax=Streptomyces sp. NPDC002838 TaxID=3154436 RepID=UPI00331E2D2F